MTLVAIDKEFKDLRRLLGAHRWADFLHKPGVDAPRVSRIYFCWLNTDQDLSKEGTCADERDRSVGTLKLT